MAFCLYEALFPLFLILYMGWVFRDRGVGWLPFTCVFRAPRGSLLRACFHTAHYGRVLQETERRERELSGRISAEYLARMRKGLGHWVEGGHQGHLVWSIFHFRKE